MKLTEAVAIFLSQKRKTTQRSYKYDLRKMVKFLGDRDLSQISISDLSQYSTRMAANNWKSDYTWNKNIKTIRAFFNFCVDNGMVDASPANILKMRHVQAYIPRDKAMPDDDLKQLLTYTQFEPRYHALILFLADTGCRARGASQLKIADIDFRINEALVTEKGEKTRKVHFGDMCGRVLQAWLNQRSSDAGEYVFSPDGSPMLSSSVSQIVRRLCKKAGIKPRGSHSLRHRKGHQLAAAQVPISLAMMAMGHENPDTTYKSYYDYDWDKARQALDKLAITPKQVRDNEHGLIPFPRRKTK